jgi:flagellar motor protein MotB
MIESRAAERASYRQGLVMGLTMAEVMLLVVFTLLLVAGVLLQKTHDRAKRLEQEAIASQSRAKAAAAAERRTASELRREIERRHGVRLPEDWRELVRIQDALKELHSPADSSTIAQSLETERLVKQSLESLGYHVENEAEIADAILKNLPPAGEAVGKPGHDWPPIIRLSEADHYYFELGKAEISSAFRQQLAEAIIPRLIELIREYDVDVIEVIGHTDEVPVANPASNLDAKLIDALKGRSLLHDLTFSDNAGLAIARASAVARVLIEDGRLKGFRILPLSGAQVITTDERLSDGSSRREGPSRRRIEIRLRRTSPVQ